MRNRKKERGGGWRVGGRGIKGRRVDEFRSMPGGWEVKKEEADAAEQAKGNIFCSQQMERSHRSQDIRPRFFLLSCARLSFVRYGLISSRSLLATCTFLFPLFLPPLSQPLDHLSAYCLSQYPSEALPLAIAAAGSQNFRAAGWQ